MANGLAQALDDLSAGRIDAARAACIAVLRNAPEDAAASHLLGLIEHRAGDFPAAQEHLRRAADSPAATVIHLLSYAELCLKATDPGAAVALLRRAVARAPDSALGWLTLGRLLLEQRQFTAARSSFARALQASPTLWEAADGLAKTLQELGSYHEALLEAQRAAGRWPGTTELELRAADIELDLGRHAAALDRLQRAAENAPDDPRLVSLQAHLLRRVDRIEEACALCDAAAARGIASAELLRAHGLALQWAGREPEALALFERAAADGCTLALSDQGVLLTQLGRTQDARDTFERVLQREPTLADAWYHKTNAGQHAPGDPNIAAMQALLAGEAPARDRLLLHFALGKAHMDAGDAAAAFAHWQAGNGMKRAMSDYDPDAASRRMAWIARQPLHRGAAWPAHDARSEAARRSAAARAPRACDSELPVFVVGMPRSGSSLLEQILASHPDVHGGGELLGLRASFEAAEGGADDSAQAEAALARLRRAAPTALRIIDKDLANFLHLGTILRLFPRARIIHCRRNPLDTCFSAYTKLFAGDLGYAYDLAELGRYYRDYHRLMMHWRGVLPGEAFMEVDYENLVGQTQAQTRRLLHFLGLPWHDACTRFFENPRTVRTASVTQVRRPIYRSSVERAASLRAHLEPLVTALGDLGPVSPRL